MGRPTHSSGATKLDQTTFVILENEPQCHFPTMKELTDSLNHRCQMLDVLSKPLGLGDPDFSCPGRIDILFGGVSFWKVMERGKIVLHNVLPIVQETKLGWVVAGRIRQNLVAQVGSVCHLSLNDKLDNILENFGKGEETYLNKHRSTKEEQCEAELLQGVSHNGEGWYTMRLPNMHDLSTLALRHMKVVPEESQIIFSNNTTSSNTQFTSTRLLVVFEASAKTDTVYCLNDLLLIGPIVQDDLFTICLEEQRDLQTILWCECWDEPMQCYRLRTLTYGTACAPFLQL
ncbi:hypothetical protein PR048_018672 [Dryococelus australis]|uniref:Peptidase aspartic putative domain-containing protein n=1 Tax=Dryococelus australis TaxID=614101 RepID=A0ABQ9HD46_9NEOP|nr:hypothetical protein PR048_018672 [Dryococelus australis]